MGKRRRLSIHVCTPWNDCHMDGFRLNIATRGWWLGIALNPAAKFAHRIGEPARWTSFRRL